MVSVAFSTVLSASISGAYAQTGKNEPTLEELKNSKDRGLIMVPIRGSEPTGEATLPKVTAPKAITPNVTTTKVITTKVAPPAQSKTTGLKDVSPAKLINKPETAVKHAAGPKSTKPTAHLSHDSAHRTEQQQKHANKPEITEHKSTEHKKTDTHTTETAESTPHQTLTPVHVQQQGNMIVKAWLNKPGESPRYKDGERMEIHVTASRDCNLMIFDFDGKGKLTQIFPNQYQPNGFVKGSETVVIGGEESPFDYSAAVPRGISHVEEHLFIYAYPSDQESPISVAWNAEEKTSPFRSSELTLAEYRKLVNQSQVFFSRDVKIRPKQHMQTQAPAITLVKGEPGGEEAVPAAPNKVELSFLIEAK